MKTNNALICLDCDEIHTEGRCPVCLSKSGYPLRKWIEPMIHVLGGKHDSTSHNGLQKESQEILHHIDTMLNRSYHRADGSINYTSKNFQRDFLAGIVGSNCKAEPFKPKTYSFDDIQRIFLADKYCEPRRGYRANASYARMVAQIKVARDYLKGRFVHTGKESTGGMLHPEDSLERREEP